MSFYYQPDLSAGSFRTTALVAALREQVAPGSRIDVVTTLPNRYATFTREAAESEDDGIVRVRRMVLPPHRSGMLSQSRAFVHFARQVSRYVAQERYDVVFATSSRLMTAALGAWVARAQGVRLYLDIRDLFVDTMGDLLPGPAAWLVRGLFSRIESWALSRADRINIVSRGFEDYVRVRYPDRPLSCFTNGIDEEFLSRDGEPAKPEAIDGRATVLYAGNLGEGQALHEVLPGLAAGLRQRARFLVIGDGGRRAALEAAIRGMDNVELRKPMTRRELLMEYRKAHVLFLHLGDRHAFRKVLPSKLFEYAALGKPVLAGVAGYAAQFVHDEIDNAAVFPPCDVEAGIRAFDSLQLTSRPRPRFIERFSRTAIMRAMAGDILALMPRTP